MQHALDMFIRRPPSFYSSAACLMAAWVRGAPVRWFRHRPGRALALRLARTSLLRADYGNIGTYIAFALLVGTWALGRAVPRRVLWGASVTHTSVPPVVRLWRSLLRYPPVVGRLVSQSNIFADTLLPLVGIAGGVALFFRGIRRWAALVPCFIGLGFLVLTGSRAAIVGLIVSALLLFYLRVLRRYMASASVRQKTVAAVTAVVLGAGLFYGLFLLRPGSVMGRLLIYRITAASLVQHPSGNGLVSSRTGIYPTRPPISNGIRIALSAFTPPTRTLVSTNYYRRATNSGWAGIALFIPTLVSIHAENSPVAGACSYSKYLWRGCW